LTLSNVVVKRALINHARRHFLGRASMAGH